MHLSLYRSRSTIIQEMRLLVEHWCMYWSIGPGLKSSMGFVYFCSAGACIALSVLVYNHPRDASISALMAYVLTYWSWSIIIQGMRLFLHFLCIYRSISLGLKSSKGCVYFCTAGASIGLAVLVYNDPRDASIGGTLVRVWVYWSRSALLVHLPIYWSRSTIIQRMRLLRHCRCIYWSTGLGLQSSKGCSYFCTAGVYIGLSVLVFHRPRAARICWFIGLGLASGYG